MRRTAPPLHHGVGRGDPDAFLADGRGAFVEQALRGYMRLYAPAPTRPSLSFPEGVIAELPCPRHVNPTPYIVFLPLEVTLFRGGA